jgi:hypothetical protein
MSGSDATARRVDPHHHLEYLGSMRFAILAAGLTFVVALAAFRFQERASVQAVAGADRVAADDVAEAAPVAWQRPDGPVRVALQAGHWKAAEAPDEQAGLRTNGTRGGGKAEWEVNLEIARLTAALLEDDGYVVEILPTTIPPGHWADLFVSIHADGSSSPTVSGYRAAAPRRDATGRAGEFAALLNQTYGVVTGLPHYPLITRRMRSYYAFNHRRYQHALHPMTVGVILETGFLTSPRDRRVIVNDPRRAARGIAAAVTGFLPPDLVTQQNAEARRQEGKEESSTR